MKRFSFRAEAVVADGDEDPVAAAEADGMEALAGVEKVDVELVGPAVPLVGEVVIFTPLCLPES